METRTFDTPDGLELELRIPSGRIQIRAEETVTTRLDVRGERDPDDFWIAFDDAGARGHRLTVEHRQRGKLFGGALGLWGENEVVVDITMPSRATVSVETGSADLDVTGTIGSLDVRSGSGDCRFDTVDGDVEVKTASGDVSGGTVGGRLSIHTASGDTRVRSVSGDVVGRSASGDISIGAAVTANVTTVSGDVELLAVRSGDNTIRSVSGDVEVGVPRGSRVYLDLMSTSGSTTSDLDMSGGDGGADGGADLELHVSTVSGDIRVVRTAADA